jgi:hypothetical protein
MGSLYRYDHLQLNQRIARQGAHANGGPHVAARLAEHFQQQVGSSVDDCGRIGKSRDRVDIAIHTDNLLYLIERSQCVLEHGELGQGAGASSGIAFGDAAIGARRTGGYPAAIAGDRAREIEQISYRFGGLIIATGRGWWR